jgi:ribonuclease T1
MLRKSVLSLTLALRWWFVALGLLLCGVVLPGGAHTKEFFANALTPVAIAELPPEGRAVYKQIHAGEPFTHSKDGSVFGNRERLLPLKTRGYYREYTVRTPYVKNRGARRIVCGGLRVMQPDTCYYTDDHYASFRKIEP